MSFSHRRSLTPWRWSAWLYGCAPALRHRCSNHTLFTRPTPIILPLPVVPRRILRSFIFGAQLCFPKSVAYTLSYGRWSLTSPW
jgi:hypothetical protein